VEKIQCCMYLFVLIVVQDGEGLWKAENYIKIV
jgi:hypothetical protein